MEDYHSSVNGSENDTEFIIPASSNATNGTWAATDGAADEEGDGWIWDDATWILCASFIIFTMQTGED